MSNKVKFATKIQESSTTVAQALASAKNIYSVYFDRGYSAGGSDPIIDEDLLSLGLTAADLASFITMADQLAKFFNNEAVTTGDYDSIVNKLRLDV